MLFINCYTLTFKKLKIMIHKRFEYIKKEDRDIDGFDYVFENIDGSEWIGMRNGVNCVASYDDAVKLLSVEYLPYKKGRYPHRKPLIVDISKPQSMKTINCVMVNIINGIEI